jgi:hypothetical protein
MTHRRADFMRISQPQIMHRVFVERLDAQGTTQRNHSGTGFDMCKAAPLIDAFAANDAQVIPVGDIRIF